MSPSPQPHLLVVGDVMTDIIVTPEGPIVVGSDRRAQIRSRPGGSGANQAVWLGAMGAPVMFAARVGAEDVAQLTAYFARFGVSARLAADAGHPSGVLVTLVDPGGERSFLTDRGANLNLSPADLPETMLDGAAGLVLSGYSYFAPGPREAVMALSRLALARGIGVHIDPASVGFLHEVGTAQFLEWTRGATTIFANADEALALTGHTGLEAQMRALGQVYDRVIIKRGAEGAALGDREGVAHCLPALKVLAVDSTGAGDAFAAAFLAAELNGAAALDCLAAGIAAGAEAVQKVGGQPDPRP